MCRLLAYLGTPIIVDKLLYEPKNSLVNQSINAREIEEPLRAAGMRPVSAPPTELPA